MPQFDLSREDFSKKNPGGKPLFCAFLPFNFRTNIPYHLVAGGIFGKSTKEPGSYN